MSEKENDLTEEKNATAQSPENASAEIGPFHGAFVREDVDYEAQAMQDAIRRAHDEELNALANLALFRSYAHEHGLLRFEREHSLNPREVDRHLRSSDDTPDSSKGK